jgi:hypothetical protein
MHRSASDPSRSGLRFTSKNDPSIWCPSRLSRAQSTTTFLVTFSDTVVNGDGLRNRATHERLAGAS